MIHFQQKKITILKKNRVLHVFTNDPDYFFDISIVTKRNSNKKSDLSKVIFCENRYIRLEISKNAPKTDVNFLAKNFKCSK